MDLHLEFSDNEIREELVRLGYSNIPNDKLQEFRKDLDQLIRHERSKGSSANSSFSSLRNHNVNIDVDPSRTSQHDDTELSGQARSAAGPGKLRDVDTDRNAGPNPSDSMPEVGLHIDSAPESLFQQREDLQPSDIRFKEPAWKRPKTAPMPGYYSLYEMSSRVQDKPHDVQDDISETDSETRRLMKRKTLRKNEEGSKFIDETVSESDTGSITDAHEMMERLVLQDIDNHLESRRCHSARSSSEPPPYRLSPDDPRLPSVIYSSMEHPHTKNLRRMDPVARYHEMKQVWAMQRPPGEKLHKRLRWNIREQMLDQYVPEKKQHRVYVPNSYVVPTEKKRAALCWQIRMDMAQGNMPDCGICHDF